MSVLYKAPLEIDHNTIKAFDMVEAIERNNVDIQTECTPKVIWVIGTLEQVTGFFRDLDGPAQSFPIDEFKEWVQDYQLV